MKEPVDRLHLAHPLRRSSAVDPTALDGKVLFGYQGWFGCAGDGSPVSEWRHWFDDPANPPTAAHLHVAMWPDTSEFDQCELYATAMQLPDGQSLMAYSAHTGATVARHFKWLREYKLDGVALQRFVGEVQDPRFFDFRNDVAGTVRAEAEETGRVFYVEFDVSGVPGPDLYDWLTADWAYLVDNIQLTDSDAYRHHNRRPVVEV